MAKVNVKSIEYVQDTEGIIMKNIRPDYKRLGRRLGRKMKAAAAGIQGLSQEEIYQIENTGKYLLEIEGEEFDLTKEDFVIGFDDIEGWLVAKDESITVALDSQMDDD